MAGDRIAAGRRWLEAATARTAEPTLLRARVLNRAGGFAWGQGDDQHTRGLQEQALAIQETIGDRKEISRSLQHLGILAGRQSDYERAGLLFERSLAIEREADERDFYDDAVARLHALLDSTACAAMWKEGRSLTFAQVPATAQIQL